MILQDANDRNALLITADKDFGELVFRLGQIHAGVVLLRLFNLPPSACPDVIVAALRKHEKELPGAFSVIAPGKVRIRRTL